MSRHFDQAEGLTEHHDPDGYWIEIFTPARLPDLLGKHS